MFLLQIDPLAETAPQVINSAASLSVWELTLKGGWIMLVLALLSLLAIYLFVRKWLEIRSAKPTDQTFVDRIKDYVTTGRPDAAINLCHSSDTPLARMIEKGVMRLGRPMQDVQLAIENVGNVEMGRLRKGLPLMATIAAGAPMLGFLGTVTGMMRAFYDMASAGQSVDISLLSGGIYEALVTTVGGLVVGIVALFGYNILIARIDSVVNGLEAETLEFIDLAAAETHPQEP